MDMTGEYSSGSTAKRRLTKAVQERMANVAPKGDGPNPDVA